jgi:signal transduction histidine kinase/DNA-binding response OmpR family regulator
MRLVLLFISLLPTLGLLAFEDTSAFVFTEENMDGAYVYRNSSLLFDTSGEREIQDLLKQGPGSFTPIEEINWPQNGQYALWARLSFRNETGKSLRHYINGLNTIDDLMVYYVRGDSIVETYATGRVVRPEDRHFYARSPTVPLELAAGEEITLYSRQSYGELAYGCCAGFRYTKPQQEVNHRAIKSAAWNYFYFGAMSLLGLLSMIVFWLFRERIFLVLGALILLLGLYFPMLSKLDAPLYPGIIPFRVDFPQMIMISGILLTACWFIAIYLSLKKELSSYLPVYWTTLSLAVLTHLVGMFVVRDILFFYQITNLADIACIVTTLVPVIILAWRGKPEARILLTAISALFIGGAIAISVATGWLPRNFATSNAFQIGSLLFAGSLLRELFSRFASLRRQRRQLQETNLLRNQFFANITHELRTPLTLMLGPIRELKVRTQNEEELGLLQLAEQNAERQLSLVNQLLEVSRLEAGAAKLEAAPIDLQQLLQRLVSSYESLAKQVDIDLLVSGTDTSVIIYADTEKVERIFLNLLSNAIKFTPIGGSIGGHIETKGKKVIVQITNTGQGISADRLPYIFDRFFQAEQQEQASHQGSGIGLALVKELVSLHHGTITVDSQFGKRTTFTLTFPIGKEHLEADQIIVQSPPQSATPEGPAVAPHPTLSNVAVPPATLSEQPRGQLPKLLLIEDHPDIRAYIERTLVDLFEISTATNGKAGVRAALETPPDIIISDIMMPKMNGYEVCNTLKNNLATSHVPIILLTARSSREARLDGLGLGADDYIVKPFDAGELRVRAVNLVQSRQLLRERFAVSISIQPSEIAASSLDQEFLTNALDFVESKLDDPSLNIDTLALHLKVSRTNLNRKFRALLNKSSNQFIQSIRLQRAAALLCSGEFTAAEITHQCGFSSQTYFTKLFKTKFGTTPAKYASENTDS